jgi:hypothetical protein
LGGGPLGAAKRRAAGGGGEEGGEEEQGQAEALGGFRQAEAWIFSGQAEAWSYFDGCHGKLLATAKVAFFGVIVTIGRKTLPCFPRLRCPATAGLKMS